MNMHQWRITTCSFNGLGSQTKCPAAYNVELINKIENETWNLEEKTELRKETTGNNNFFLWKNNMKYARYLTNVLNKWTNDSHQACLCRLITNYFTISDLNKLCGRPPQYAPPPASWPLYLLTLKVVSESRVTWPISVPILVFLGLSVLDLGPMYVTDRKTSVARRAASLNAPTLGAGHNNESVFSDKNFSYNVAQSSNITRIKHRQR